MPDFSQPFDFKEMDRFGLDNVKLPAHPVRTGQARRASRARSGEQHATKESFIYCAP
jgi:hypothetical protein